MVVEDFAGTFSGLARLLDHFGREIRSLSVCGALLLFASVAYGAGSYQRTKDGKTLVWNESPKRGEVATWSGKRDKKGYAVGSGTLTWYKAVPTFVTGSLLPDTRKTGLYQPCFRQNGARQIEGSSHLPRCQGKKIEGDLCQRR